MRAAIGLAWACCLVGSITVPSLRGEEAEAGFAYKVRGALQLGPLQDGLGSKLISMGMEADLPFGKGHFYGELGYQFKTGNEYLADLNGMNLATSKTAINPAFSVNSEKNKLEGVYLRLGYGRSLSENWTWKAGLQLGGVKFTNQAIGFITDGSIDAGGNLNQASYLDTFAHANSKTTFTASPFADATYRLDAYSSFEVGLLLLSYKSFTLNHVAGTVATDPGNPDPNYVWGGHEGQDSYSQKQRLVPQFEFAYVFHF